MVARRIPSLLISTAAALAAPASRAAAQDAAEGVLRRYCLACHRGDDAEADVQLDGLAALPPAERTDLIDRVREMLRFGEMPPEDLSLIHI